MLSLRYLAPLLVAATSYAQLSFAPQSLNFVQRQSGDIPYPLAVAIAGTGVITLGTCVGPACPGMVTTLTSNNGPATLLISWNGYVTNALQPGTFSASLPIIGSGNCGQQGCSVNVTLVVIPYTIPTFVSPGGGFSGCSRSSPAFFDLDTCISGFVPGSAFTMPLLGRGSLDPNFGGLVRRISNAPRNNDFDSTVSGWNANNSLVVTANFGGTCFMTDPNTGIDIYSAIPCPTAWDANDPDTYYYFANSNIHKVVLRAPPSSVSDVVWFSYPNSQAKITTGGDGDTSADNWISFWADADRSLGLVNLSNPAQVYYANLTALPWFHFRTCAVSKGVDSATGKRYVIALGSDNPSEIFSFRQGDTLLTDEGTMPRKVNYVPTSGIPYPGPRCGGVTTATAQECLGAQHSDTVAVNGIQYYVFTYQQAQPFFQHIVFMRFNVGPDLMATAVEAGGGMTYTFPVFTGNGDVHVGCAKKASSCVVETDNDPPLVGWQVTNATNSSPITIFSQPAYTGANGDILLLNNVGGNTSANGLCIVGGLAGSSFQCIGSAGSGAYIPGSGSFIRNVPPADSNHQAEVFTIDAAQIATKSVRVNRLAKHRSFNITGDYLDVNGYYGQSHPNISPDGTMVVFESNNGTPDNVGVFTVTNSFSAAGTGGPTNPSVNITAPASGSSLFGPQVTISAVAKPGTGATITAVHFMVDGSDVGTPVIFPPFQANLDTTRYPDGPHTLSAIALDSLGDSATALSVQINIDNGPAQSGGVSLVSTFALTNLRNDYGGGAGLRFTVSSTPLLVTALGRMFVTGNTGTHTLKLVGVDGVDIPGSSVNINMSGGAPLHFMYGALANPIVVSANTVYGLVSSESVGGDQWYDSGAVTTTPAGTVSAAVFLNGTVFSPALAQSASYVPVTLLYKPYAATPPVITITSPAMGATVGGKTILITASFSSPIGLRLVSIQFTLDGANLGSPLTGAGPYTYTWDTTSRVNGQHTLAAVGTDSAGNVGTSPAVSILVFNAATVTVSLTSPLYGAIVSQITTVSATASSSTSVITNVQFQIDGANLSAPVSGSGPFVLKLDTTSLSNGSHSLRAVATDALGTTGVSSWVPLVVSNSADSGKPFITGQISGAVRNNYTGFLGMQVILGTSPVSVNALGRMYVSGNKLTHTLKLVDARTSVDVPGSSVSITMIPGTDGVYQYVSLSSPIVLQPNTAYYLLSSENYGGDQWHDYGPVTGTGAATITGPVSQFQSSYILLGIPDQAFAFVNMRYSAGSGGVRGLSPFLSGQGAGSVENGYTGNLGMAFTTGPTALIVTHLGRLYLTGNIGIHRIKLVRASDGSDLPNGTVSLSMAGGTSGTYSFGALTTPITLQPGTTYYVLSEETLGGDSWFGYGPVSAASVATVGGPVYGNGAQYQAFAAPGYGFGPVNFYYQ